MSIPTTMKFIVRGKSVDFKNREGSSPSIPKKAYLTPKLFTLSFRYRFKIRFRYGYHSLYSFTKGSAHFFFSLIASLVVYIYDTRTNKYLYARNRRLNDSQYISLFVLKLTKFF